ncbi:MAG: hypothetical protein JZU65_10645, partial [Chlorobium sp.]|nr:hypothetical protein [Chlorobium sp.]
MKSKIITIASMFLMFATQSWGVEIRQYLYSYTSTLNTPVQIPIHQTFVIERHPSFYPRPECRPFPVVYFDLGSAWLSPDAGSKLMMDLGE